VQLTEGVWRVSFEKNMASTPRKEVLILGAARTPVGNLNGALSTLPAHELGSVVIEEALKRAGTQPEVVSEVLMGQILTAGDDNGCNNTYN